jgi:hypothetical protein
MTTETEKYERTIAGLGRKREACVKRGTEFGTNRELVARASSAARAKASSRRHEDFCQHGRACLVRPCCFDAAVHFRFKFSTRADATVWQVGRTPINRPAVSAWHWPNVRSWGEPSACRDGGNDANGTSLGIPAKFGGVAGRRLSGGPS